VHKHCPTTQRALRRLSIYAADVIYPRTARPLAILPDELTAAFRAIFDTDRRGAFPRTELERLRLRRCSTCSEEHGRVRCPACQTQAHLPPSIVHGRLRWQTIAPPSPLAYQVTRTTPIWIEAGALWRRGSLGPERIGNVLPAQTHAWVGAKLGVGFYRAGGYAVGFVFRPGHGLLDDRVVLPKLRGKLVDAHAVLGDDRAWLVLTFDRETIVVVIAANGSVLASDSLADSPWLAGIGGACAAGPHLFVPTDDGITRVEVVQGAIVPTRVFAETAPLVGAADRLTLSNNGIDVIRRRDAIRMQLT
jgi:hypothetical protein